ncbi:uncharacterized protein LOC113383625 [Ctenocephalides felis]|uniref:uncharacterized protein LOC113383625 n=1 Tax=Ctenocephalides felis TaxID=7515 RepID=UPI000E6E1D27|nr:uncharacterized protein LOC113383625 [Ctenocephalides felis]
MKLGSTNGSTYSRPKLGALRSSYSSLRSPKSVLSGGGFSTNFYDKDSKPKKSRSRKQTSNYYGSSINGTPKMDYLKKRTPNYTDLAYREAVTRLRYLMNENYSPVRSKYTPADSGEETDDKSFLGIDRYPYRTFSGSRLSRRYPILSKENVNILRPTLNNQITTSSPATNIDAASQDGKFSTDTSKAPPELMTFIEKQEEYIEQLERESQYCRDELSGLLSKVKDVISENESLHEKQKDGFIRSIFDNIHDSETEDSNESDAKTVQIKEKPSKKIQLEGPSIVFESRISELEAQLTQYKIDLKKLQDENESLKKKECVDCYHSDPSCKEGYRKQIDNLQRYYKHVSEI